MTKKKKNLILGVVKTYPYKKLKPFIETLNKTSFDGELVLFVSEVSKRTKKNLRKNRVKLIEFENTCPRYQVKGLENFEKRPFNQNIPLVSQRFLLYLDYLQKNKQKYKNVMLTDIGDVVFQKNLFGFGIDDKLCVFEIGGKIGDANQKGIDYIPLAKRLGVSDLKEYKQKKILCAGTTIGPTKRILEYLKKMKKYLDKGNDQALHNYLVYSKKLKNVEIFENGNKILTIGRPELFEKHAKIKNIRIHNKKGQLINVIHNYDRHPKVLRLFGGQQKNSLVQAIHNSRWRMKISKIKNKIYKIPILGEFIRKVYIGLR